MSQQLAYVIITPYSLHKSHRRHFEPAHFRTGLDLVAAGCSLRAQNWLKYSEAIVSANDPAGIARFRNDPGLHPEEPQSGRKTGSRRRVMMLLFRGEDAVRKGAVGRGQPRSGTPRW